MRRVPARVRRVRVALDLGYGTLPRLVSALGSVAASGLDAVVVTHDHPDDVVDLHGLFRARLYGADHGRPHRAVCARRRARADHGPRRDGDRAAVQDVFAWRPLPEEAYDVGPFRLESRLLSHYVPNAGVRLSTPELTVAYTGDTGPDPNVPRSAVTPICSSFARPTDTSRPVPLGPAADRAMNMTSRLLRSLTS